MIDIAQLDIFISKTCNLACHGCITFSDGKLVKGVYRYNDEQLKFWSQYLNPANINLFGGEPLVNPDLEQWAQGAKKYFPNAQLYLQTNGVLLREKHYHMQQDIGFNIIISQHMADYADVVWNYIDYFKSQGPYTILELEGAPTVNGYGQERGWKNEQENYVHLTESYLETVWWEFYGGTAETSVPKNNYFSNGAEESWTNCVAREYVNLVNGDLYKCPASAGLLINGPNLGLNKVEEWEPYFENYEKLQFGSDYAIIDKWFKERNYAQNICNMCTRNPQDEIESQNNVGTKVKLDR